MKGKRILITGSTGFIGANLCHFLVNLGIRPSAILRKESDVWRVKDILNKLSLYYADLVNKNKVEEIVKEIKPQIIFHAAVYGSYSPEQEENKIVQTNIMGTINLVYACAKVGFDIFVNTGSSSEYGMKNKPIKEIDPLEPNTIYGISKASSTLFCRMKAKTEDLPIVTLRLFSPYGYYEEVSRLIPSVIISRFKGKRPRVFSRTSVRDFIFIEDVIDAYIKTVENKDRIAGEIFNVGYGKQYSVEEVTNKMIELTGNKVKPEWDSVLSSRIEPKMWQADISKAKNLLDWQPQYNLEDGLKKNIEWFRKYGSVYSLRQ